MPEKVISISIAAYNVARCLPTCLDSLLASRRLDALDVIVVNDGSTDDTLKVAQAYARKHPGSIWVVDKENGGHGSTINAALAEATGTYFKLLDADDWVDPAALDDLVAHAETSRVDLLLNQYVEVDETTRGERLVSCLRPDARVTFGETVSLDETASQLNFYMHEMTLRTSVARRLPAIDEHCFYVDTEYVYYALANVDTVELLEAPVYHYLCGQAGQSMNREKRLQRMGQRERVLFSLIDFYERVGRTISPVKRDLVRRQIQFQAKLIYADYLRMQRGTKNDDARAFDERLHAHPTAYGDSVASLPDGTRSIVDLALPSLRRRQFRNIDGIRRIVSCWDMLKRNTRS